MSLSFLAGRALFGAFNLLPAVTSPPCGSPPECGARARGEIVRLRTAPASEKARVRVERTATPTTALSFPQQEGDLLFELAMFGSSAIPIIRPMLQSTDAELRTAGGYAVWQWETNRLCCSYAPLAADLEAASLRKSDAWIARALGELGASEIPFLADRVTETHESFFVDALLNAGGILWLREILLDPKTPDDQFDAMKGAFWWGSAPDGDYWCVELRRISENANAGRVIRSRALILLKECELRTFVIHTGEAEAPATTSP